MYFFRFSRTKDPGRGTHENRYMYSSCDRCTSNHVDRRRGEGYHHSEAESMVKPRGVSVSRALSDSAFSLTYGNYSSYISLDTIKVKIADLGNACFADNRPMGEIQTRQYRSPEAIASLDYDHSVDIWSFGCMVGIWSLLLSIFLDPTSIILKGKIVFFISMSGIRAGLWKIPLQSQRVRHY